MTAPEDCVFCRIIAGGIPATFVGESDSAVAFQDAAPAAPVHLLVVPRTHVADAAVLDGGAGELLGALFALANQVAAESGLAEGGYRLVFNVGEDAGNTVPHLHLHVLGGRQLAWPPG